MTIRNVLKNRLLRWVTGLLITVVLLTVIILKSVPDFGGTVEGERLIRAQTSSSYGTNSFTNHPPQKEMEMSDLWDWLDKSFSGDEVRVPPVPLPVLTPNPAEMADKVAPGLRAIWMGHATVLLEIDGVRLMTDPVLSERTSPFAFMGPSRFHPVPIALEKLPLIHAVVISHDHYDHLDMSVVKHLASQGTKFFVPLGIGAHLERWSVPENQIIELDWGQSEKIGSLTIHSTPSRHYSGRRGLDYNATLWSSWSMIGPKHRAYYSGDTGYAGHFKKTGRKFGPFDLTIIKVGSYGDTWLDIHMDPEHAVQAHIDLKGKRMLPVHWATFNLAYHAWQEPIERTLASAKKKGVTVLTPRLGEEMNVNNKYTGTRWWENIK